MAEDDDIGYRRPPKRTRFVKGRSGNRKGRPKPMQNLSTLLVQESQQFLVITEGGVPKKITKMQAWVKSLWARTIKGDRHAEKTVLVLYEKFPPHALGGSQITEADEELYKKVQEAADRYVRMSDEQEEDKK